VFSDLDAGDDAGSNQLRTRPTDGGRPFHSFLVIALATTTMVLETGAELKEVSESVSLKTNVTTLCCGNLFVGGGTGGTSRTSRIAQVHAHGVCVTNGGVLTQEVSLHEMGVGVGVDETRNAIVDARVAANHVLCRLSNGALRILFADETTSELKPVHKKYLANLPNGADIATAALVDDSTHAATHPGLDARLPGFLKRGCVTTDSGKEQEQGNCVLAVCRVGGTLELYSLPKCEKIWTADGKYFPITTFRRLIAHTRLTFIFLQSGFGEGVSVLAPVGSGAARENARFTNQAAAKIAATRRDRGAGENAHIVPPPPEIVELRMDAFSTAHDRPLLTAIRGDGVVLAYRGFLCPPGVGGVPRKQTHAQLRFSRIEISVEGKHQIPNSNDDCLPIQD